jgi:uncharacterized paraquat-inducible protein A
MANRVLVIALRILAVVWLLGLWGGITAMIDGRYETGALILFVTVSAAALFWSLSEILVTSRTH